MSIFLLNKETKVFVSQMWTSLFSFYVSSSFYVADHSISSKLGPNNVSESPGGGNLPGLWTTMLLSRQPQPSQVYYVQRKTVPSTACCCCCPLPHLGPLISVHHCQTEATCFPVSMSYFIWTRPAMTEQVSFDDMSSMAAESQGAEWGQGERCCRAEMALLLFLNLCSGV